MKKAYIMKKSISRSFSIRTIASFTYVTYLGTLERARVYYSNTKRCYYLSYSFLKTRYLRLPLGGLLDYHDDLDVLNTAVHYISKNFIYQLK